MNSDTNASGPALPADDRDWSVSEPTDGPHWPDQGGEAHVWGGFPGIAVEMGGYGDLEMIHPSTGRRLWLGGAFDQTDGDGSFLRALRRLVDLAEATGFLDDEDRAVQLDVARRDRLQTARDSK